MFCVRLYRTLVMSDSSAAAASSTLVVRPCRGDVMALRDVDTRHTTVTFQFHQVGGVDLGGFLGPSSGRGGRASN